MTEAELTAYKQGCIDTARSLAIGTSEFEKQERERRWRESREQFWAGVYERVAWYDTHCTSR